MVGGKVASCESRKLSSGNPTYNIRKVKNPSQKNKNWEEEALLSKSNKSKKGTIRSNLPIPKGGSAYALAKQAEYKERDIDKAEKFYREAIHSGDRVESAIKDLASLLHQAGRTKEAIKLLETNRIWFLNSMKKFDNLYNTLRKQITCTGNSLNKRLKLSSLSSSDTEETVRALFKNSVRILDIELNREIEDEKINYYAVLHFSSHSSARKTLEGYHHWDQHKVEWISDLGEVLGDAHYARHKMEEYRKNHPTFEYRVFERDPKGYVLSMPIDGKGVRVKESYEGAEEAAKLLLGDSLFSTIFIEWLDDGTSSENSDDLIPHNIL